MDAFVKLSDDDKIAFCEEAEARLGLPAASLEKDYWVCWTLCRLFELPGIGEHLCFKGGTSLSKAWKLINRFSEDIDIVIDRGTFGFHHESPSAGQLNRLREKCSRYIQRDILEALTLSFQRHLPEAMDWSLEVATKEDDPDEQSLIFHYPGVLKGRIGYLRPAIKLEFGARGDTDPVETPIIRSYLCEVFPTQLGDGFFQVRTVSPLRTFWEKAMLLHEETFRTGEGPRKRFLARHYYDLWAMGQAGIADQALANTELFERILDHRKVFFGYNWMDYNTVRPGTFRFKPHADQEAGWRQDYEAMRAEMFFGETPGFDAILEQLKLFEERFN